MDNVIKLLSAFGNGVLRIVSALAWPIGIGGGIAVGALLVVMYWGGSFTSKKTLKEVQEETVQEVTQAQRDYVAAAIARDAINSGEPNRVHEGIAWAVINYSRTYNVDIPTVVSKSLTTVPVGYERRGIRAFQLWWVKRFDANAAQWNAALARADQLLARGKAALSDPSLACVTHYIRKPRSTFTEPSEATERLIREMREVPTPSGPNPGAARFFCPR